MHPCRASSVVANAPGQSNIGLRSTIRTRTRLLHERVEARTLCEGWLDDRRLYALLLSRLLTLHMQLESHAYRFRAELHEFDLAGRSRRSHIEADLDAMDAAERVVAQRVPGLSLASAGYVLGGLYVVEGATLGGAIVAKRVAQRLGLTSGQGCAYFSSYGADTGRRWSEFCAVLDRWGGDPDAVAEGAVGVFGCYDRWVLARPDDGRSP